MLAGGSHVVECAGSVDEIYTSRPAGSEVTCTFTRGTRVCSSVRASVRVPRHGPDRSCALAAGGGEWILIHVLIHELLSSAASDALTAARSAGPDAGHPIWRRLHPDYGSEG